MSRVCRVIGTVLCVLGVLIGAAFIGLIAERNPDYNQAALARKLNQGNAMYDLEFKGAQVERSFQLIGVMVGILLVINGATLLGLGVLAARVRRKAQFRGRAHAPPAAPS